MMAIHPDLKETKEDQKVQMNAQKEKKSLTLNRF